MNTPDPSDAHVLTRAPDGTIHLLRRNGPSTWKWVAILAEDEAGRVNDMLAYALAATAPDVPPPDPLGSKDGFTPPGGGRVISDEELDATLAHQTGDLDLGRGGRK